MIHKISVPSHEFLMKLQVFLSQRDKNDIDGVIKNITSTFVPDNLSLIFIILPTAVLCYCSIKVQKEVNQTVFFNLYYNIESYTFLKALHFTIGTGNNAVC